MGHPKNQVGGVECRIRFPSKLSITERISKFQEAVCSEYPEYIPSSSEVGLADIPKFTDHEFISSDGHWKIKVTTSSISLSTTRFEGWGEFNSKMDAVVKSAIASLNVSLIWRTDLMILFVIRPSNIGFEWFPSRILRSPFGNVFDSDIGAIDGVKIIIDYDIDENIKLRTKTDSITFVDGEKGISLYNDLWFQGSNTRFFINAMDVIEDLEGRMGSVIGKQFTDKFKKKVRLP